MASNLKITAIIQVRLNSMRLPEKAMKLINGKPLIQILIDRLSFSKEINNILIATSKNYKNKKLVKYLQAKDMEVFEGSENNVLKRYYEAAKNNNSKIIVRITGDSPLVDSKLLDNFLKIFKRKKLDYLNNTYPPTFPDGLDIEVFTFKALKKTYQLAKDKYDKEHVTPFMQNSKIFKKFNIKSKIDFSKIRLTVDEKEDIDVIELILNYFNPKINFNLGDIINLYNKKPNIFKKNSKIIRNEGANLNKNQKLWKRAKKIIPGGNMLLSKRPELFLPGKWPTYFSKAKNCTVWDLEGKKYLDTCLMGVGTNILGYCNSSVDNAVKKAIKKGTSSTLNCEEEVLLAEKLIEIHPWAEMVRFARTGGEANAIAIRIARAASGKDKIAFCGYHGWHDWYLSANLSKKENLNSHLLPGLDTKGIPKSLKNSAYPFNYNRLDQLEKIVSKNSIGTIIMEVSRNFRPENNFLKKVKKLAKQRNIILIFDECTSAFRENFGGLHKIYGVEPDIAIFAKSLGNGYPIAAIIGKKNVMEVAQETFISSTFWTERIGPAAALKTLEIMEKNKTWEKISNTGKKIDHFWIRISKKYGIDLKTQGLPALVNFSINSSNWLKYKTYITQEMLKKGFLASNAFFSSVVHSEKILKSYFENLEPIFKKIGEFEKGSYNINIELETEVSHSGFKRLN